MKLGAMTGAAVLGTFAAALSCAGNSTAQQPVELPAGRVQQIVAMLSPAPHGLGVPCANRAVWADRNAQLQNEVKRAEGIAAQPMPAWSDEDYLDFSHTGQRPRGEAMLHARQDRLVPLVLAECSEWKGRFVPAIIGTLDGLAEQPTWTLPAHDVDLSSFHRKRYRVELNSAVLADDLAEALYLLGNAIPLATQEDVRAAIVERTLDPSRAIFAGTQKEFWLRGDSNWNAVCLDGVTGAALALLPAREDRAYFAAVAEAYSQNYLKSFTSDGYSEEGIGYWSYGFTHYSLLRETLWHQTAGRIDLFRNAAVESSALFGHRFQMLPGVMADFGDARFGLSPNTGLIAYIDHAYGLQETAPTQQQRPFGESLVGIVDTWNLVPILQGTSHGSADSTTLRQYFPVAGVLVSRPATESGIAITMKGGGNGGHSHNDIGSFSIGLGLEQLLGDPGGPMAYTADTFSSKRFDSKLLNSYGHPVPMIDGHLEKDATTVKPTVLKADFSEQEDVWALDLKGAYDVPGLRSFTRTWKHTRAGRGAIEIVDDFDVASPTEIDEAIPTHGEVKVLDVHSLLFTMHGERVLVSITSPATVQVHQERINEYGNPFIRVGVKTMITGRGQIRIKIEPQP
ncbi:hypothetical protein SAMN05421819_0982 [Bryocella elongata]|uniref:Heparinase II/III-like protein n=1 Tax=Bryocella elongata TaxID=863522 RepID=A0A1H5UDZ5_9BACT|nr:hypothetical protein [Bryocella elongata]SEF73230.1 hypothetical protein SAMN05421819_0982 [Bryocella elongata]